MLGLLADDDVRAMLRTLALGPATVPELVDRCDIPTTTSYRKIDALVDLGVVSERVRIQSNGRHASEYRLSVDTVEIVLEERLLQTRVDFGDASSRLDIDTSLSVNELPGRANGSGK